MEGRGCFLWFKERLCCCEDQDFGVSYPLPWLCEIGFGLMQQRKAGSFVGDTGREPGSFGELCHRVYIRNMLTLLNEGVLMVHLLNISKPIQDPIETLSKLEFRRKTGAVEYATANLCVQPAPVRDSPPGTGAIRGDRAQCSCATSSSQTKPRRCWP